MCDGSRLTIRIHTFYSQYRWRPADEYIAGRTFNQRSSQSGRMPVTCLRRVLIMILNVNSESYADGPRPKAKKMGQLSTMSPRQNGRHFPDVIFKCILLNQDVRISIKFSLKFVSKSPIDNNPVFVQIMAWCRSGDKPLSEPMIAYVADAYMRHSTSMS